MEQIKIIVFVVLLIAANLIIIALFLKGRNDRILNEVKKLQIIFNEIRTTPLSLKFNTAQAVAKRNDESDKEIKEYYSRYKETQSVIDEVDNMLVSIENFKREHNYKAIQSLLPSLHGKIEKCFKEIKDTDDFLQKYENKDTGQRVYSTKLKQEFQVVRDTIRKNASQLSIAYDAIEARLDRCSSLFTKSEDSLYANDFITAQDTLEQIEKSIRDTKIIVNEIPQIVKESTVIIPSLIEEAESSSSYIKQKGVYLDHLKVSDTLSKATNELKECTDLASKLEISGLLDRIQDIKNRITSLNSSLANEDSKYVAAKQKIEEISTILIEVKNTIDFIRTSVDNNKNLYASNQTKPDVDAYSQRLEGIDSIYLPLTKRLEILEEPVSTLYEKVEEAFLKAKELKEELVNAKENFDKSVGDIQRARTSLIKFQLVVNQAEISVRASHLPSISDSFTADLKNCKEKIKEIRSLLEEPTVDLKVLNSKIKEAMDFIYGFSSNVKNLVGLSIITENAIVFGNKFRSSHEEIDSDLSKSEFSFLNGEYTKAVQLAIKTMDTLYPNSDAEIKSVNN